jgi:hypothetical protein
MERAIIMTNRQAEKFWTGIKKGSFSGSEILTYFSCKRIAQPDY